MGDPSAKSRYRVVGLLVLLFGITYLDRVCISVAGPRIEGEPDRRGHRAAAGGTHPEPVWMAGFVFRVWSARSGLGGGLVHLVPRLPFGTTRHGGAGPGRASIPLANDLPLRKRAGPDGDRVLLCLRLQFLPDLVSHLSPKRARIHGRGLV